MEPAPVSPPTHLEALLQRFTRRYRLALLVKAGLLAALGISTLGTLSWRMSALRLPSYWTFGVIALLGSAAAVVFLSWLKRRWLSTAQGAVHLDAELGLQERLITAFEFAAAPQSPALYPLLIEDAERRISIEATQLPKPLSRTSAALAIFLLLLLLWPIRRQAPIRLASLRSPPSPQPSAPKEPPPQPPEEGRSQQGQSAQQRSASDSSSSPNPSGGGASKGAGGGSRGDSGAQGKEARSPSGQGETGGGSKPSSDEGQSGQSSGAQRSSPDRSSPSGESGQSGEGASAQERSDGAGETRGREGEAPRSASQEPGGSQESQQSKEAPPDRERQAEDGAPQGAGRDQREEARESGGREGEESAAASSARKRSSADQSTARSNDGSAKSQKASGSEGSSEERGDSRGQGGRREASREPRLGAQESDQSFQGEASAQQPSGSGQGSSGSHQELTKAEIRELLKEVSGQLKELQAQLSASRDYPPAQPGTTTDGQLYEAPMALDPHTGALIPIQLGTDAAPTSTARLGGGVGESSGEASSASPRMIPEEAHLSSDPLPEEPSGRQSVPPEYRDVFEKLHQRPTTP